MLLFGVESIWVALDPLCMHPSVDARETELSVQIWAESSEDEGYLRQSV